MIFAYVFKKIFTQDMSDFCFEIKIFLRYFSRKFFCLIFDKIFAYDMFSKNLKFSKDFNLKKNSI